ncbi:hypothetical protein CLU79DRAFT_830550 [Phycomyces nitens]|nr:hypothetical protein CLU79DRAFT_830550 [Phycomyces nitens]
MTHLSDFSFLQRVVSISYLTLWYIYRLCRLDRFQCLSPSRLRKGELKSIVSLLILIMLPFQLTYDVVSSTVKYKEGYIPHKGQFVTKPEILWSQSNKDYVVPTDYSLCIGFSLQTSSTLLLLQCFWNYLANLVAGAKFMSSKEFKCYIVWTCVSIVTFPVIQYNYSRKVYTPAYKEVMPQLVYGCELTKEQLVCLVFNSCFSSHARSITRKIGYFKELNRLLSLAIFLDSLCFIILSVDGLTGKQMLNVNVASIVVWVIVILIFHPTPESPLLNSLPASTN